MIEDMEDIERHLQGDLHLAILDTLSSQGAQRRGDVVELDDVLFRLFVSMPTGTRSLHVVLGGLSGVPETRRVTHSVAGFGLVREISIELPHSMVRLEDLLAELATTHYRRAYMALETAFVATYGDWVASLFSTAYGIVNTELLVRGHTDLCDRFWFSVTDLDDVTFRYHFSRENLASTVAWLTSNQDSFVSPCAAATLLITEDVSDGVIGTPEPGKTIRYDDNTLIVEFAALPTLGFNTAFWVAERSLFENNALAAIHIHDIDGRAFELNCPGDAVERFATVIAGCRADLETVVRARYKDFRQQQRKLRDAVERAKSSVSWMREMGTDFAARVVAELLKA